MLFLLLIDESIAYSFPSGHTTLSVAAITIVLSGLYVFKHYPSNIVAGIVLG